jgi:hypothetical protein
MVYLPSLGANGHDTICEARRAHRDLVAEISECKKYSVICIDPEHLRDDEFRKIIKSKTFRSNLIYKTVEEGHLVDEWYLAAPPLILPSESSPS